MLVEWEKESHNPYSRSDSGSGMQRKRQTPTPRNADEAHSVVVHTAHFKQDFH